MRSGVGRNKHKDKIDEAYWTSGNKNIASTGEDKTKETLTYIRNLKATGYSHIADGDILNTCFPVF